MKKFWTSKTWRHSIYGDALLSLILPQVCAKKGCMRSRNILQISKATWQKHQLHCLEGPNLVIFLQNLNLKLIINLDFLQDDSSNQLALLLAVPSVGVDFLSSTLNNTLQFHVCTIEISNDQLLFRFWTYCSSASYSKIALQLQILKISKLFFWFFSLNPKTSRAIKQYQD